MSDNEMFIEIDSGAKAVFVNPKTKKMMYQVTDRNKHYEFLHIRDEANEYCSIKKIDKDLLECTMALDILEKNLSKLNLPKDMNDNFIKIYRYITELLENNPIKNEKFEDFVIKDQFYQSVTIYEKEKNPFKDSN